jgi:glycosyltransferase involved in cell wall biosynthesis
MESPLISICIPTYKRADLLISAIESCLQQSYKNIEVIVSDDSPDDCAEKAISHLIESKTVRYYRNFPALKQAANVNQLFDFAQGDYLVLLHDDDLLLPDAIEKMFQCFRESPDIVGCFGKQQLIDMDGTVSEVQTEELNQNYHRVDRLAGIQKSSRNSALVGQFPNDGYMIRSDIAKDVRYRDLPEVGDACDYDFALRLSAEDGLFYFLNEFTSAYRITDISILKGNNYSNLTYNLIQEFQLPDNFHLEKKMRLNSYASPAINKWLQLGAVDKAKKIYLSENYSWRQRLSGKGIIQFLLVLSPKSISAKIMDLKRSYLS